MSTKLLGKKEIRGFFSNLRTTETDFRKHVWQRWQNPNGQTVPGFLVGCGRSGTSMLVRQLGKSWRVELYNEDNTAAFERWRLRDLSVIESLINRTFARIILFKPILDTYRTTLLLAKFSNARAIFIFRHYDDVVNSSLRRFGTFNRLNHVNSWINEDFREFAALLPPKQTRDYIRSLWTSSLSPESAAALYWLFQNRLYFDLELDRDECVRLIQYESIVSNPVREINSLCRFIGLTFEPAMAEGVFSSSIKRDSPPEIDSKIRAECENLWRRLCQRVGTDP